MIPSFTLGIDEHPPADVSVGMRIQQRMIEALQDSPQWDRSAYILTYDEHGGYFDHVPPPQADAYGLGIRVPDVGDLAARQARHLRADRCTSTRRS